MVPGKQRKIYSSNNTKHPCRKKIPVYGDGLQIRDWLYVEDHCRALTRVWKSGVIGEKYNIGGECEVTNINLVKKIYR